MKVNLGCGHSYIDGWVNVDPLPTVRADVYMDAFEFVQEHGPEVTELYMGHFIEHLLPASATALLALMADRLPEGAQVSAVVPDIRAVFVAYDRGELTNEFLNERFIYSYEQPSHHVWCYDADSLRRVFEAAGYTDVEEIDPLTWEPVFWKEGVESRWQCGVRATAPAVGIRPTIAPPPNDLIGADGLPVLADEVLLRRIQRLRARVEELEAGAGAAGGGGAPAAHSMFDRLPGPLGPVAKRLLPEGSAQRRAIRFGIDSARSSKEFVELLREESFRSGARTPRPGGSYTKWRAGHDASGALLAAQHVESGRAVDPVRVECIVLHADRGGVERTLRSLTAQSWSHWNATVIGRPLNKLALYSDARISSHPVEPERVLAESNAILSHEASRDFVVFVEAGDKLAPDLFFEIAHRARRDPLIDLMYWDDDLLDEQGKSHNPRFRPEWSPDIMLGANYIGSSFAMRHRRFASIGGLRPDLGDATWWDLIFRAGVEDGRVKRLPRVLSHVGRRPEPSLDAGVAIVREHLERVGEPADVSNAGDMVRVKWAPPQWPHVTVIVPTRHNRPLMSKVLEGLSNTDYPSLDVVVVDNGERSEENERWYAETSGELALRVEWWTKPFNYSAVNNAGAALAGGEVLVFLNDDTELPDPSWMGEMVGWALRPAVGTVGAQMIGPEGEIQHGGVVLGMNGFADHLFQGMQPGSESLLGPTNWYRDVLAVTGACLAIRRSLFEDFGGFDERFELCGSDVTLGLDAVLAGKRNVCTPFTGVHHLESATRGTYFAHHDLFASYWRYQHWVVAGDPYFSPNLSMVSREPALRSRYEPPAIERMAEPLGREIKVFRMQNDAYESTILASMFRATDADARAVEALHAANRESFAVKSVNWFLPDIDSPFYGGINTALRLADHLARTHGVENRFVFWSEPNEAFFRSAINAAFPSLAGSAMSFHDTSNASLEHVPYADAAVATLWATAYSVAQFEGARRKFYMIQDYEPMFYPAGTLYTLAEESYRLGLYGLCNTEHMRELFERRYGGKGMSFQPSVDPSVFHAEGRRFDLTLDHVATVFVYARPGHWRNCWELASLALEELKDRLGDRVRIVTAGSWARPDELGSGIEHLGLLDYRATGDLYRRCDVGVALTVSEHPSYLPLELMACGVPVVAFDNPAGHWLLRDHENSLLARRTVDALRAAIERIVLDPEFGRELSRQGIRDIAERYSSWEKSFSGVYEYLCDPEP